MLMHLPCTIAPYSFFIKHNVYTTTIQKHFLLLFFIKMNKTLLLVSLVEGSVLYFSV